MAFDKLSALPPNVFNAIICCCKDPAGTVPKSLRLVNRNFWQFVIGQHTRSLFVHERLLRDCVSQGVLAQMMATHNAIDLSLAVLTEPYC